MKTSIYIRLVFTVFLYFCLVSCEDFVEIDAPMHKIIGKAVFNDEKTAQSALQGIYNQLIRAEFSGGWENSITALGGLSADYLENLRPSNLTYQEFDQHEILPDNSRNLAIWSSSYNIIYMTNSIIEGLQESNIEMEVRKGLEGEARFVRAFTYFYLTNLYNDIPLLLTTDYIQNSTALRNPQGEVYQQIIIDLEKAIELLPIEYRNGERTSVNQFTAMALLARVHLYQENWSEAEMLSSGVISQSGNYEILESLNEVFLANSKEAIWQISPEGRGNGLTHTNEGSIFNMHPTSPASSYFKLNNSLITLFEPNDMRLSSWVNFHEDLNVHYAFKYKDRYSNDDLTEHSMVMRLAEQYLIRAEARAKLGEIGGAISDLNVIRKRAGVDLLTEVDMSTEALIAQVMLERGKELFTEWGHRWFDLKRTGKTSDALSSNPLWEPTDVWYPIPEQERMKNPNLSQNPGY